MTPVGLDTRDSLREKAAPPRLTGALPLKWFVLPLDADETDTLRICPRRIYQRIVQCQKNES